MPAPSISELSPWRFCVAPMLEWSDRHCRYFHRQLTRHARLYTEMIATGALLHGAPARWLDFDRAEHPVALQLGGSDPAELAACARLAQQWGYDEVNLNCGCPSPRVQRGAFGACLMAAPRQVADCVRALLDAVSIPVTVKHRIGIDRQVRYEFLRDFVGTLFDAGCRVFLVHARAAWLDGLSPKDNRSIPPLDYAVARRLKADFPAATIVLNGGLASLAAAAAELDGLDGVMLGRAAYHDPYLLAGVDGQFFGVTDPAPTRAAVIAAMSAYLREQAAAGVPPRVVTRHLLGLYQGQAGARRWRRLLSDPAFVEQHGAEVLLRAAEMVASAGKST